MPEQTAAPACSTTQRPQKAVKCAIGTGFQTMCGAMFSQHAGNAAVMGSIERVHRRAERAVLAVHLDSLSGSSICAGELTLRC